jgi:hypothetical protein
VLLLVAVVLAVMVMGVVVMGMAVELEYGVRLDEGAAEEREVGG